MYTREVQKVQNSREGIISCVCLVEILNLNGPCVFIHELYPKVRNQAAKTEMYSVLL